MMFRIVRLVLRGRDVVPDFAISSYTKTFVIHRGQWSCTSFSISCCRVSVFISRSDRKMTKSVCNATAPRMLAYVHALSLTRIFDVLVGDRVEADDAAVHNVDSVVVRLHVFVLVCLSGFSSK